MILAPTLSLLSTGTGAALQRPTFSRDFAGERTLNNGTGPAITFTRASDATYFDANGVLQTAANNVPRFDHDPATGASRGLLIEEARTNSIRNSQAGGSTNGVIGSGGVLPTNWASASTAAAAYEIIGTGTEGGFAYIDIKISGTNSTGSPANPAIGFENGLQIVAAQNQVWTSSLYVSLVAGSTSGVASFDINIVERDATGAVLANSGTTFTPTATRTRYSHTRTMASASTGRVTDRIRLTVNDGQTYDLTLRIAAPQLEQGAFPTSYIPTTTAAATRSADSAVVTPISSFYNQAEGTLFAEGIASTATSLAGLTGNTSQSLLTFNISTESGANQGINNALLYRPLATSNGGFYYGVGGSGQATITQSGFTQGTIVRLAGAYALNDFAASVAGAAVGTDTSGSVGLAANILRIGTQNTSNAGPFNGHIRKIAYYPKRLSNTLLEQLTT